MKFLTVIRPGSIQYKDPAFEEALLSLRRGAVISQPTMLVFTGMPKERLEVEARQVALRLGRPLMRLDPARAVSKLIGETEKNIEQVLHAAEASGAVLVFDEADALFGGRTDVKDSHDRYANLEAGYLVSRLEQFRGLIVITSNSVAEVAKLKGRFRQPAVRPPPP